MNTSPSNPANVDTPGTGPKILILRVRCGVPSNAKRNPFSPHVQQVKGLIERPDGKNASLERETLALAQAQLHPKPGWVAAQRNP